MSGRCSRAVGVVEHEQAARPDLVHAVLDAGRTRPAINQDHVEVAVGERVDLRDVVVKRIALEAGIVGR